VRTLDPTFTFDEATDLIFSLEFQGGAVDPFPPVAPFPFLSTPSFHSLPLPLPGAMGFRLIGSNFNNAIDTVVELDLFNAALVAAGIQPCTINFDSPPENSTMCDPDGSGGISAAELGLLNAHTISEAADVIVNIEASAGDSNNNDIIDTPGELFQLNFALTLQFAGSDVFPGIPGPPRIDFELCAITGVTLACDADSDGAITPLEFIDIVEAILGQIVSEEDALATILVLEGDAVDSNNDGKINTPDELAVFNIQFGNICAEI